MTTAAGAPGDELHGNSVGSRDAPERKALLTPNVEFLRNAYHRKADPGPPSPDMARPPADDGRWTYRADPLPATVPPFSVGAQQGMVPMASLSAAPGAPLVHSPYGPPATATPPPGHFGAPPAPAPVRSRYFAPKKWRVVRTDTVVRATEHLNSEQVRVLQEGEIVEQVAPAFTFKNGIVRLQIRHPSSPQFPNPIGWVTQDATAAGGPKFLEPGPEPMQKPQWRPPLHDAAWDEGKGKGKGKAKGKGGPPGMGARPPMFAEASAMPRGGPLGGSPGGLHQNLTWKPPGQTAPAASAVEVIPDS